MSLRSLKVTRYCSLYVQISLLICLVLFLNQTFPFSFGWLGCSQSSHAVSWDSERQRRSPWGSESSVTWSSFCSGCIHHHPAWLTANGVFHVGSRFLLHVVQLLWCPGSQCIALLCLCVTAKGSLLPDAGSGWWMEQRKVSSRRT